VKVHRLAITGLKAVLNDPNLVVLPKHLVVGLGKFTERDRPPFAVEEQTGCDQAGDKARGGG
jgi:hypothetical protein